MGVLLWCGELNKTHACPGSDKNVGGRRAGGKVDEGVKEGVGLSNVTILAPCTIPQFAN